MKRRGPWKVISSKVVYRNPWITVREDRVIHPNGKPGLFGVVAYVSGSSVIPVDAHGNAYLIKESHYALGRESIQAPGGAIDCGETRLAAAKRELLEETGIRAKRWTYLGVIHPYTMVVHSANYMYLAEDLEFGKAEPDGMGRVRMAKMSLRRAVGLIGRGAIVHAATCVALLKVAELLRTRRRARRRR